LPFVPILEANIFGKDPELIANSLWAISYIAECDGAKTDEIISKKLVAQCVVFLNSESKEILQPAAYLAGAICQSDNVKLVDEFLDQKPLEAVGRILEMPVEDQLVRDALFIIRNLVDIQYGGKYLNELFEEEIYKTIISFLELPYSSPKLKTISLECIGLMIHTGDASQTEDIMEEDILAKLTVLLDNQDPGVLLNTLKVIDEVFYSTEEDEDEFTELTSDFDADQGVDKVTALTNHPNHEIAATASNLLNNYFYVQEVPEGYTFKNQVA